MSYHIYTSRSLVLSSRPLKEADRVYSILTRDFGLVRASAGAVRKEASKLRGGLEPLSFSSVSFVRGKEYWRVTSSVLDYNTSNVFRDKGLAQAFARAASLVEKLVVGESAHPELIECLEEVVESARSGSLRSVDSEIFEILLVARVLYELGYVSKDAVPENVLKGSISSATLATIEAEKKGIIKAINTGIQVSGLAA